MADKTKTPIVVADRYVTQTDLDRCVGDIVDKFNREFDLRESRRENAMLVLSKEVEDRLKHIPTREERRNIYIGTVALVLAGLALLQMWFTSGWDASENSDGLEDKINQNEKTIERILSLQEAAELRSAKDSKNLQILVDGHTHRLNFSDEEKKPE